MSAIDRTHSAEVCKTGQGAATCKFVMLGPEGLECAKDKGNEPWRAALESKSDMVAQGDNCIGWERMKLETK